MPGPITNRRTAAALLGIALAHAAPSGTRAAAADEPSRGPFPFSLGAEAFLTDATRGVTLDGSFDAGAVRVGVGWTRERYRGRSRAGAPGDEPSAFDGALGLTEDPGDVADALSLELELTLDGASNAWAVALAGRDGRDETERALSLGIDRLLGATLVALEAEARRFDLVAIGARGRVFDERGEAFGARLSARRFVAETIALGGRLEAFDVDLPDDALAVASLPTRLLAATAGSESRLHALERAALILDASLERGPALWRVALGVADAEIASADARWAALEPSWRLSSRWRLDAFLVRRVTRELGGSTAVGIGARFER